MSGTSKTKICGKCELKKPISEFYKSTKRVKRPWCKPCMREVSKAKRAAMTRAERSEIYHRRGKVISKRYKLRKYGLTEADCPDKCEVCGDFSTTICIDHDHSTGLFRGFLCTRCNFALGFAKDNPKILRKLANYLSKHERETSDE